MTPEEAAKNIRDAVSALESGSRDESKAAFEFLRQVPDEYRVALREFEKALQSTSVDARMEAGAALAKFGRGEDWVLPALKDAYVQESSEFVRSRLAFSIASVKTTEAASILVELFEHELQASKPSFSLGSLCDAIASFGALAAHELPNIDRLVGICTEQTERFAQAPEGGALTLILSSLLRAQAKLVSETMTSYFSYSLHHSADPSARLLLRRDSLALDQTGPQFDQYRLVFDGRVDYLVDCTAARARELLSTPDLHPSHLTAKCREVRCVLFENEPDAFVCIAVWDHFSSSSLMNKFEDFAQSVVESLFIDRDGPLRIEFGIFQPVSEGFAQGEYTGVEIGQNNNNLSITQWLPDSRLDQLFGQHTDAVRSLMRKPPPLPEGFMQYIKGRAQDSQTEARLDEARRSSPDGRLDYSGLKTAFSDQVAETIQTGNNPVATRARICGDSLDPAGNQEFFARALPKPIRDVMNECQRIAKEAAAHGDKNTSVPEWPDLELIPTEFIVRDPRPYEIEATDGVAQVTLALDPATHGVILFRCMHDGLGVVVTNVPFSVFEHCESFGWGYRGAGPYNFSKNIINAFVPPGSDGKPEVEANRSYWGVRKQTFASYTADKIAAEFYKKVFLRIPAWGGYISAQRMKEWILGRVATLR